jgi:hypothetical protein
MTPTEFYPTAATTAFDGELALARWVSLIKTARCSGSKVPTFSTWLRHP